MACEPLTQSSTKALLQATDNFLFACDGVLWDSRGAIPGSLETVSRLKKLGKKVFFLSNNSSKTRQEHLEQFKKFGFPDCASSEDIMCASYLSALYLHELGFKDKVFLVGNAAMGRELTALGIRHIGLGDYPFEGRIQDWLSIQFDPEVRCVLVGLDTDLSFMKIMHAATYLQDSACLFLATSLDSHLQVQDSHVRIPEAGTMVQAVSLPSEREPTVLGKPAPHMFLHLQTRHNLDPTRCLMVGNSLASDVAMAKSCGLRSLLVLTGSGPDSAVNGWAEPGSPVTCTPDLCTPRLADLASFI